MVGKCISTCLSSSPLLYLGYFSNIQQVYCTKSYLMGFHRSLSYRNIFYQTRMYQNRMHRIGLDCYVCIISNWVCIVSQDIIPQHLTALYDPYQICRDCILTCLVFFLSALEFLPRINMTIALIVLIDRLMIGWLIDY